MDTKLKCFLFFNFHWKWWKYLFILFNFFLEIAWKTNSIANLMLGWLFKNDIAPAELYRVIVNNQNATPLKCHGQRFGNLQICDNFVTLLICKCGCAKRIFKLTTIIEIVLYICTVTDLCLNIPVKPYIEKRTQPLTQTDTHTD